MAKHVQNLEMGNIYEAFIHSMVKNNCRIEPLMDRSMAQELAQLSKAYAQHTGAAGGAASDQAVVDSVSAPAPSAAGFAASPVTQAVNFRVDPTFVDPVLGAAQPQLTPVEDTRMFGGGLSAETLAGWNAAPPGAAFGAGAGAGIGSKLGASFAGGSPSAAGAEQASSFSRMAGAGGAAGAKVLEISRNLIKAIWEMLRKMMARIAALFGAKVAMPEAAPNPGDDVTAQLVNEGDAPADAQALSELANNAASGPGALAFTDHRHQIMAFLRTDDGRMSLAGATDELLSYYGGLVAEAMEHTTQAASELQGQLDVMLATLAPKFSMTPAVLQGLLETAQKNKDENLLNMFDPERQLTKVMDNIGALKQSLDKDKILLGLYNHEIQIRGRTPIQPAQQATTEQIVSQFPKNGQELTENATPRNDISHKILSQDDDVNRNGVLQLIGGTALSGVKRESPEVNLGLPVIPEVESAKPVHGSPFSRVAKRLGVYESDSDSEQPTADVPRGG